MAQDRIAGFSINMAKGFSMTFENGTTISVQFGGGNYCANREHAMPPNIHAKYECPNAEIAIWNAKDEWITNKFTKHGKGHDVEGWLNPESVLKAINWTAKYDKRQGDKS
jgi:hypothetical protein